MNTNQTIDGVPLHWAEIEAAVRGAFEDGKHDYKGCMRERLRELCALLNEDIAPACKSCGGEGVVHTGIDESPTTHCNSCDGSGSEPAAKLKGEPVVDALSTGFYTTETGGGKYAINIGFRSMADMQAADQQLRDLLRDRHAEQSAPVEAERQTLLELQHELAILHDAFKLYPGAWCCKTARSTNGWNHNHDCKNHVVCL